MGIQLPQEKPAVDLNLAGLEKGHHFPVEPRYSHLCKENGVTVVKGQAFFLSDDRIGVETDGDFETYKFEHAIIATGPDLYSFIP